MTLAQLVMLAGVANREHGTSAPEDMPQGDINELVAMAELARRNRG